MDIIIYSLFIFIYSLLYLMKTYWLYKYIGIKEDYSDYNYIVKFCIIELLYYILVVMLLMFNSVYYNIVLLIISILMLLFHGFILFNSVRLLKVYYLTIKEVLENEQR